IERLTVEPHSIKPILSFNYRQLYSLSLVNFPEKIFLRYFTDLPVSIYNLPPPSFKSSTLTNLKINVEIIDDCLDLLDGRLNCLSTLIIRITQISSTISNTDNIVSTIFYRKIQIFVKEAITPNWELIPLVYETLQAISMNIHDHSK
ncbi:unnamed protein product, partial [Rotaria sp. Silwood1]